MSNAYWALMLEGPTRGKVYAMQYSRMNVPMPQPYEWFSDFPPGYAERLEVISFDYYRISLFEATVGVWVPSYLKTDAERNLWALNRLIDPKLISGLIETADVPAEWLKPVTYAFSERQRELESDV